MKFTPRKNAFTKGILGILVSVFFLSPISMTFSPKTKGLSDEVLSSLIITSNISKVEAQSSNDNEFGPTMNPLQDGLDGTTNSNRDYTSVNSPYYVPSTDPPISNGPNGSPSASTQSSAQTATADPKGSPTDQAGATTKNPPENGKTEQNKVIQFLGNILLGIGAFFAMLTGTLLDASLKHLVFEMGVMVNQNSFGGSITQMWTLLRDICNLLFIFGFIYLGIRTIIDPESATVKRTLARIIIGALLINFSLFIVKFVIDVSNFTALKIYQAMTDGTGSVTGAIMQIMGVSSFYSSDMKPVDFTNITTAGGLWFYVMGALMFIVIAVTFAIAAVMLIVRFAVLIFLMLGAPLLFAAPVFPQLESIASGLWKKLFSNAFFAPVYLLLVLISIKLMEGLVISMKGGILASQLGAPPTSVDAYSMVLNFLIIIFFLIQSLVIAQKMGAVGGDTAVSAFHGVRKSAQVKMGNATAGLVAAGMRSTIGRAAHSDERNERLKNQAARGGLSGWSARQQLKAARAVASSSFDVRNVAGVGEKLGVGAGAKGGYTEKLKETKKKEEEFMRSLAPNTAVIDVKVAKANQKLKEVNEQIEKATETKRNEVTEQERIAKEARDNIRDVRDEIKDAKEKVAQAAPGSAELSAATTALQLAKDKLDIEKETLRIAQDKAKLAKTEVATITGTFATEHTAAKDEAKVATDEQKAIKDAGVARQREYARTAGNTWYKSKYTNQEVEAHLTPKVGTQRDNNEVIIDQLLKGLKEEQTKNKT